MWAAALCQGSLSQEAQGTSAACSTGAGEGVCGFGMWREQGPVHCQAAPCSAPLCGQKSPGERGPEVVPKGAPGKGACGGQRRSAAASACNRPEQGKGFSSLIGLSVLKVVLVFCLLCSFTIQNLPEGATSWLLGLTAHFRVVQDVIAFNLRQILIYCNFRVLYVSR